MIPATHMNACQPLLAAGRSPGSRRQFLKGLAALTAPCFVPARALGRDGAVAPSERLVMGCIGVGGQGTRQMAGGIWSPEGGFIGRAEIQIVAVSDANANNRDQARDIVNRKYGDQGCAAYRDFRELIARRDIDVCLVAN